jgi:hypothetical protein
MIALLGGGDFPEWNTNPYGGADGVFFNRFCKPSLHVSTFMPLLMRSSNFLMVFSLPLPKV